MSNLFAVDKYMDAIKVKAEREFLLYTKPPEEKYHYFDTEEAAKSFILARAREDIRNAEVAEEKARARYRKCFKKYGPQK